MTPEKFVERVLKTVVEEGNASYQEIFADPGEVTDEYWQRVLELYRSLSPAHRKVILEIMRQVSIDTIAEIFGILDGSSGLDGRSEDFELFHKTAKSRVRLNGDLQDLFLAKVEGD